MTLSEAMLAGAGRNANEVSGHFEKIREYIILGIFFYKVFVVSVYWTFTI